MMLKRPLLSRPLPSVLGSGLSTELGTVVGKKKNKKLVFASEVDGKEAVGLFGSVKPD